MSSNQQHPNSDANHYKDEVLGQQVKIKFEESDGRTRFYRGTIHQMRVEHFVKFEDGDERWFDLKDEEARDQLIWVDGNTEKIEPVDDDDTMKGAAKVATAQTNAQRMKRDPDEPSVAAGKKREPVESHHFSSVAAAPDKKIKTEHGSHSSDDQHCSVAEEPDKKVKPEPGSPSSNDRHCCNRNSSDDSFSEPITTVPDPLPSSITEVIRFMDELEPDQNWYERQADSRGECSSTRSKLRKLAKEQPNHPALAYWVQTKNWQPPDSETLFALIKLIKTMIR